MTSSDKVAARMRDVLSRICEKELTVATAESCTGGLVAALMTDIEGCSHAFDRGFVTYTDDAKRELLGVEDALLRDKGAVSEEVAINMAEQALERSAADIAVSVTGYAGSSGGEGKEGLVHFGLARSGAETMHRMEQFGARGRDVIRQMCLETVVEMIEESLE
ncbi:CinA family protein [Paracoccus sp. (in: a-proteobacteria)]|uniref:CinA family protein n=1 Tax=Paracoccus sp. TaxID=267 RepID=UPI00396CDF0E